MSELFFIRQKVTSGLEGIVGDLELRKQALIGDSRVVELMKNETKQDKKDALDRHINNANAAHKLINAQFELILELRKNK